ncbi:GGDEF domain-containing protein [Undibacterium sp. RTI2.1]|uniref:GGDEF domain-containing protein n=1 Tax=unclassified Undibacterium TaxID=2630295 RepID=UPI002B231F1A|nr:MULTISPECIES: GGDEF domain-containing protein [unclassified Undibacterium]MEB0033030.1 GGDEF domain-containing protein [Undibacterium sp. RTI2.1]MEB0118888.1 GGDEF domain-containing protein [Undibacterium sp. RTI2.2]
MPTTKTKISNSDVKSLAQVLDQSEKIKDVMIECADDLSSVNVALKQRLANDVSSLGVENALQTSQSVEEKVQHAATQLSAVNQALGDEVIERQILEQRLETAQAQADESKHASLHDPLTGLPNRLLFYDRLEHGLAQANRHGWGLAVFFVDLDNFKIINDTLGHATGDHVLKTVALRLKETIRNDDTLCRHGGDEFLYLLLEVGDQEHIAVIADKIMAAIEAPIDPPELSSITIPSISASIGIAIFPKNGSSVEALIKSADEAMYKAKLAKENYVFA